MERSGLDAKFTVQPWKRVYESALNKPNYMVSCIGRIPKREDLFNWVGPVTNKTFYNFYKLKAMDATLTAHEDVLNYKVGVLNGSLTHDFLKKLNHPRITTVAKADQLIKLLKSKRVDLILEATNVIEEESKLAGIDPNVFEMALVGYGISINLALSKTTSPEVVKQIQDAYKSLESEGKIILQ